MQKQHWLILISIALVVTLALLLQLSWKNDDENFITIFGQNVDELKPQSITIAQANNERWY